MRPLRAPHPPLPPTAVQRQPGRTRRRQGRRAGGSRAPGHAQHLGDPHVAVHARLHRRRVAAAALERPVERVDRLAEAGAGHHRLVRRHHAGPVLGVPVPERGLPGDGRVLLDEPRVVEEVDAQGVAGSLVVEVPAEHDRPAPVVGRLARRAAERLLVVALDPVVRLVDLLHVPEPDRLEVRVREERRGLARPGLRRPRAGERRVRAQRVDEPVVRVERVPLREDRVELRAAHHEVVPAARAPARVHPDARRPRRLALGPPPRRPVPPVVRRRLPARVRGRRRPRRGARGGARGLVGARGGEARSRARRGGDGHGEDRRGEDGDDGGEGAPEASAHESPCCCGRHRYRRSQT